MHEFRISQIQQVLNSIPRFIIGAQTLSKKKQTLEPKILMLEHKKEKGGTVISSSPTF
jgi:hypothetical protein